MLLLPVSLYGSPSLLFKHSVDQEGLGCKNTVQQLMLAIIYFLYVSSMTVVGDNEVRVPIIFYSLAVAYSKENLVYLPWPKTANYKLEVAILFG